jgi:hypothetical protein
LLAGQPWLDLRLLRGASPSAGVAQRRLAGTLAGAPGRRSVRWDEALGGSHLADDAAGPALGDPEPLLEHDDCSTAAVRG